jgi:hypothetical protein
MPRLKPSEEQHHNLSMLRYGVLRYCRACSRSLPQCKDANCNLLKFRESVESFEQWQIGEISGILLGICSERCGSMYPLCHSFADGRYTLCTLKTAQIAALQGWQGGSIDIEANPLVVESGRRKKAGWDYVG